RGAPPHRHPARRDRDGGRLLPPRRGGGRATRHPRGAAGPRGRQHATRRHARHPVAVGGAPPVAVTLAPIPPDERDDFFAMLATYQAERDQYDAHSAAWDTEAHRRAIGEELARPDSGGREISWVPVDGERAAFAMVRVLPDWPDESRD